MTLTQVDSQTQTATYVGSGISISGITGTGGGSGNWTLKLNVQNLTTSDGSTPMVRFEFDDTVTSFSAYLAGPTSSFQGSVTNSADKVRSWKQEDFPSLRMGVTSAQLRLQLTQITANTSCTYRAWLEY